MRSRRLGVENEQGKLKNTYELVAVKNKLYKARQPGQEYAVGDYYTLNEVLILRKLMEEKGTEFLELIKSVDAEVSQCLEERGYAR